MSEEINKENNLTNDKKDEKDINKFFTNFKEYCKDMERSIVKKKENANEINKENKLSLTKEEINKKGPEIDYTNNNIKNKIKTNTAYQPNSNSSLENALISTNACAQTTTAQSPNISRLKKKYIHKNSQKIKKRNIFPKKNFSKKNFEMFLERTKENQKLKESRLNNLRSKSIDEEKLKMKTYPTMNKISISLLKKVQRRPLYQEGPSMEEKSFKNFYNKTLKENESCISLFMPSPKKRKRLRMDECIVNEKYAKFYEEEIKWKKNKEEKNKKKQIKKEMIDNENFQNYSFKPSLNRNSITIANKLKKWERNGTITLGQFKARLKPLMLSFYSNSNIYFPQTNLNKKGLKRNLSEVIFNKNWENEIESSYNDNKYYKENNKNRSSKKLKINYKLNEKKYNNVSKKSENNVVKKVEKSNDDSKKIMDKLYKLNVRPGTSWNHEVINKIRPNKEFYLIIKNLL